MGNHRKAVAMARGKWLLWSKFVRTDRRKPKKCVVVEWKARRIEAQITCTTRYEINTKGTRFQNFHEYILNRQ